MALALARSLSSLSLSHRGALFSYRRRRLYPRPAEVQSPAKRVLVFVVVVVVVDGGGGDGE